jgi:hypothetical protein
MPDALETVADLSGEELIRFRPELFDFYDGPIYRRSPEEVSESIARAPVTRHEG